MIQITSRIAIDEREIELSYTRAPGPGGQNVNKVATAVELRFNLAGSSLPRAVRERLAALAPGRLNRRGVLTIKAHRLRTQQANRREAMARLVALARRAAQPPKQRVATTPTRSSRERRLVEKRRRAQRKRDRGLLAKVKRLDD